MSAYYNEFEPYAAQWLRNLIAERLIADGEVDERSITTVHPDDVKEFTQCHFFAGIGGWSLAARLAGWPDERPIWTGSCPCQPFSIAGKGRGEDDERHLWPVFFDLIRSRRPAVVMGEQVAAAVGKSWLDGVFTDLESIGYTPEAAVVPACAVNAPHRRDRLWFVADRMGDTEHNGQPAPSFRGRDAKAVQHSSQGENSAVKLTGAGSFANVSSVTLADADDARSNGDKTGTEQTGRCIAPYDCFEPLADTHNQRLQGSQWYGTTGTQRASIGHNSQRGFWDGAEYIAGPDGKARRFEPSIRLLAHGVPARVGALKAYGNAIVPQVAAEIIKSYMDCRP